MHPGTASTQAWQSPTFLPSQQDTEIINTAILTGRTVAIPVKVLAIEVTGIILDVSALVECESDNEDIIKVSFLEVGPLRRRPQIFMEGWNPKPEENSHSRQVPSVGRKTGNGGPEQGGAMGIPYPSCVG